MTAAIRQEGTVTAAVSTVSQVAMARVQKSANYVVGLDMDLVHNRIALIHKAPGRINGDLLNGPGGEIRPGESPEGAMAREYFEETGVLVIDWTHFASRRFPTTDVTVYFFYHIGQTCFQVSTQTEEYVAHYRMDILQQEPHLIVPDLDWLVPMAKSHYLRSMLKAFRIVD
jgi:8-oxo-dGTP diphosphatase